MLLFTNYIQHPSATVNIRSMIWFNAKNGQYNNHPYHTKTNGINAQNVLQTMHMHSFKYKSNDFTSEFRSRLFELQNAKWLLSPLLPGNP